MPALEMSMLDGAAESSATLMVLVHAGLLKMMRVQALCRERDLVLATFGQMGPLEILKPEVKHEMAANSMRKQHCKRGERLC